MTSATLHALTSEQSYADQHEPPIPGAVRKFVNDVRSALGGARPVPPAIWVKGQPMHLRDEIEFSLDLARRRWRDNPQDLFYVVDSLIESDRFLRAFWGPRWHERVSW